MHRKTRLGLLSMVVFLAVCATADEGLSNRSIDPQGSPVPVTAPVPGPMPEDKALPSPSDVKKRQSHKLPLLDSQAVENQRRLTEVEAQLKAGRLTDQERFDLQLQRDQLKKKLEVHP